MNLREKVEGIERQATGAEYSQDRLGKPQAQGTVGAGPVPAQRGQALLADQSLKSALTSVPVIPPPKVLPRNLPSACY